MSALDKLVNVLSEHPDYGTGLSDAGWRATCSGPGCGWYSDVLPPVTDVRGAGAAERAHRGHVAEELLAAGVTFLEDLSRRHELAREVLDADRERAEFPAYYDEHQSLTDAMASVALELARMEVLR